MTEMKYINKLLAFLDILGFESVIVRSKDEPTLISKIASMMEYAQEIERMSKTTRLNVLKVDQKKYTFRQFSDTCVITGDYSSHDDLVYLSMLIIYYQYSLCKEEQCFLRGAIVSGDVYEDSNVIFGPALVHAYHLERDITKAIWPRVLVDKALFNQLEETDRQRDLLEFLQKDEDNNLIYIDYLRYVFHLCVFAENRRVIGERPTDMGKPEDIFKNHKKAILKQVNGIKESDDEEEQQKITKYVELSKYHNSVIDRLNLAIESELSDIGSVIHDFFDDQSNRELLGESYKPKYSEENYPEQGDMIDILAVVISRITEKRPQDIFAKHNIQLIGENTEKMRSVNIFAREAPSELDTIQETLLQEKIDINNL